MRASAVVLAAVSALMAVVALRERRPKAARDNSVVAGVSAGAVLLSALGQLRRLMPWLVGVFARRDARLAIQRAGLDGQITARDVAAARVACVLVAAMLAPRIAAVLPLRMLPVALPALLWGASELPLHLLARRASRRGAALREALPDALDLMRACLAAGLPLRRSLSLVADHCAEPVAAEFACVAAETAFGIPQSTALDGLAARNPEPEV
ncbi:MAG: type II secretion system F family protein, partial [Thermoleophilaceae bacterium]|nr:type II secretion system F family protein [Thermoleophilaceae bacterium]